MAPASIAIVTPGKVPDVIASAVVGDKLVGQLEGSELTKVLGHSPVRDQALRFAPVRGLIAKPDGQGPMPITVQLTQDSVAKSMPGVCVASVSGVESSTLSFSRSSLSSRGTIGTC